MNSFHCRCWFSGVFFLLVVSAQAGTMPITLTMTGVSRLPNNTNIPYIPVPLDTLTLSIQRDNVSPATLTITNLESDSVDRMLNYTPGDPPSYAWTITADNANAFGINWLEFQNQLNESKPNDVLVILYFFNPSAVSVFNPSVGAVDSISAFLHREGVPGAGGRWARGFQLHEVKIFIDYYFWHPILEGLRGSQIRAEIRGEARIVPEPATRVVLSLGFALVGLVGARRTRIPLLERSGAEFVHQCHRAGATAGWAPPEGWSSSARLTH
jgi:hypothetical protein